MKTNLNALANEVGTNLRAGRAECHVVLLYDDYESGWHAMQVYERLVKQHLSDCLAGWTRWRFDDLYNPEAREAAVNSLQESDIVIVAAAETTELSVEAQAVLETGLTLDKNADRAFISLLGLHQGNTEMSTALYFYLQDLALRNGFALFHGTFELPQAARYSTETLSERASTRGAVMTSILNRPIPLHWGINE